MRHMQPSFPAHALDSVRGAHVSVHANSLTGRNVSIDYQEPPLLAAVSARNAECCFVGAIPYRSMLTGTRVFIAGYSSISSDSLRRSYYPEILAH